LLAAYPEAMRTFQNSYLSERDIDDKTAVVFFFDRFGAGGEKNRNVDGFMPRGKQFGYMFTQGFASEDDLYIGVAHELGHGMFQLKHPFDNDYKIPAYSTSNLMDYTPGATHIAKWQWDLIHDPGVILMVFEKDTDAMRIGAFYRGKILIWDVAEYKYKELGGIADLFSIETRGGELETLKYYTLSPHYNVDFDNSKKISFYAAILDRGNEKYHFEYLISPDDKELFKQNEKVFRIAANFVYGIRPLSESDFKIMADISDENYWAVLSDLGNLWVESLIDPMYWFDIAFLYLVPEAKFTRLTEPAKKAINIINKTASAGWHSGISKMAQLGYKVKLVGSEVVLYTELNKEIAKFGTNGILKSTRYLSTVSEDHYLILSFDDVPYYNLSGKEVVGQIELWKNTKTGDYLWRIVNNNLPSVIRQLQTKPSYLPLRTIWSKEGKTTTFIGKWSERVDGKEIGLKALYDELTSVNSMPGKSTTDLNIYMLSGKFDHPGGFNMLSIENFSGKQLEYLQVFNQNKIPKNWTFDDYIWETYNKQWLENALRRGDDIVLWSDPISQRNGFYKRELDFIENNSSIYGYNYNEGLNKGVFTK
jgi:hypothetical protein